MEAELFRAVGGWGRWQKITFAVRFYTNIILLWQDFAMTFLAPNVPFRCVRPNVTDASSPWPGQCSVRLPETRMSVPCEEWEYDTERYPDTLVNKWDLVCNREWLISFAKSIFMIGFMASVFIFGQVADRIGRYPTIIICYLIGSANLILSLFSPSITAFLVFRFLQAFGMTGFSMIIFVLLMETVGPVKRTNVVLLGHLGRCFSLPTLAFIGYFFRDWFWFQVAITLPMLIVAIALFFLTESPRWLILQRKTSRLEKVVRTAALRNGKYFEKDILKRLTEIKSVDSKKGTLFDLFRTKVIRGRILITMYLWLVNAFLYYALSFNTNDLFGNPYLNFLIAGVLEFPALGLLYIAMQRFGRRQVLVAIMLLTGVTFLTLIFVPSDMPWLINALSQFGKFCASASFLFIHIYTGEIFPTVVRSAALGSCSTVAGVGSALAPFTKELGKASHQAVPNVLYCVLAVSSGLFALRLPETKDRDLPDTLEDGQQLELNNRRI